MIQIASSRTRRVARFFGAALCPLLLTACTVSGHVGATHDADERDIRAMYEQLAAAMRARDVNAMMEHYTTTADLFIVDLMSDGRNMSRAEYGRHWDMWLAGLLLVTQATSAPVAEELRFADLVIVTDGTLGYAHARLAGLLVSDGLRKVDGKWLIGQEHLSRSLRSVAADVAKAQTAANESSAVVNLRTLNTALATYNTMFGRGYPNSLGELGAGGGAIGPRPLIDPELASGSKNGYTFVYSPVANGGIIVAYTIQANPSSGEGHRYFFTDETAIIRVNASQPAGKSDTPMS